MSDIADAKNFIAADQRSIPKKHYTVRAEELTLCYCRFPVLHLPQNQMPTYFMMTSDHRENITQATIDTQGIF